MVVALIGAVLAYVRLTQRGEPRRWILAGVAIMLAVALVVQIARRNRTTTIEIPAETVQQMMRSASTAAASDKSAEPLPLDQVLKSIDSDMVSIPGGTFIMGSPDTEVGHRREEGPQHEVTLSAFAMGKYEVTQAQWQAVAQLPKVKVELEAYRSSNVPVSIVKWEDAVEFCARLSKATGKTYRLPTEAEWEYAARATTTGPYAGNLDEMAWYDRHGYEPQTVGGKQPNGYGLYDMHGNVAEWCGDWFSETYYAQSPSANPAGPATGSARVYRGGYWSSAAPYTRSAYRGYASPDNRDFIYIGFRLVRVSK
jgi:formylglycine-generating enzyme required for sulfatase activity